MMNISRMIPAVPGWVARCIWLDEDDNLEVEHYPVVGWAIGDEEAAHYGGIEHYYAGEPVVYIERPAEGRLGAELVTAGDADGASQSIIDAVYYDPSHTFAVPPVHETTLREHVKAEKERQLARIEKWRQERRIAGEVVDD